MQTDKKNYSLKAGDILATREKSIFSGLIRIATMSCWSHVGMAIDDKFILEAVTQDNKSDVQKPEVRIVPIDDFLHGKSKVKHCIRPHPLSDSKIKSLKKFAAIKHGGNYTKLHAGLTALRPVMAIIFSCIAILSTFELWNNYLPTSPFLTLFLIPALVINIIIFSGFYLLSWSSRTELGVKFTEQLFLKFGFGEYLVKIKYEMFCSRLVLLADMIVKGGIDTYTPGNYEVQPKHIVRSCKKQKWELVDFSH